MLAPEKISLSTTYIKLCRNVDWLENHWMSDTNKCEGRANGIGCGHGKSTKSGRKKLEFRWRAEWYRSHEVCVWMLILSALRLDHENLATETFWDKGPLCPVGSDPLKTAQQGWGTACCSGLRLISDWEHLWIGDTWTCWPWRKITLDRCPDQRGLIQLAFPGLKYKLSPDGRDLSRGCRSVEVRGAIVNIQAGEGKPGEKYIKMLTMVISGR